jgi:dTDP-4-dehydrorhamnose 3,5-epimerase
MKFQKTKIYGVYIIKPSLFKDKRGVFRRHFCKIEFKKKNIDNKILQSNISENKYKGTLRGFHYQTYPYSEAKTLSCIKGEIYDVVIDLRKKSKTYKKWISIKLNEKNRFSIHVPKGCANAFLTLKNNCIIHYYCSQKFFPNKEKGIKYNDKSFRIKWPFKPKIISKKDNNHPTYID